MSRLLGPGRRREVLIELRQGSHRDWGQTWEIEMTHGSSKNDEVVGVAEFNRL